MPASQVEPKLTRLERRFVRTLGRVDYVVHPEILVEMFGTRRKLTPDVYVPSENLVIEVYGCFVHGCEECGYGDEGKRYKDQVRIEAIRHAGYDVDVVWQHELSNA